MLGEKVTKTSASAQRLAFSGLQASATSLQATLHTGCFRRGHSNVSGGKLGPFSLNKPLTSVTITQKGKSRKGSADNAQLTQVKFVAATIVPNTSWVDTSREKQSSLPQTPIGPENDLIV